MSGDPKRFALQEAKRALKEAGQQVPPVTDALEPKSPPVSQFGAPIPDPNDLAARWRQLGIPGNLIQRHVSHLQTLQPIATIPPQVTTKINRARQSAPHRLEHLRTVNQQGPRKNLTGRRFGKWLVLYAEDKKGVHFRWRCLCRCGNEESVFQTNLVHNGSHQCKSCRNRQTSKKRTKAPLQEVLDLLHQGRSKREIAQIFNVTLAAINMKLIRFQGHQRVPNDH